ncbi:phosphoribosylaminoimidazolesuccinocarboxamide synthase [Ammoniphilus resinae]|uniref:Phosphoribosylaminoimidazole-succinocarboxamide synthase n=1 Tax=Ammoniphilus resinae TaxID=861532 RepID=A0ABS4GJH5_9BACL|nr:phosphoribosylaminoimidazolesuccinocarboxamide synthase [Ammoniphilus resinae]MBP1930070.1 phosphoribosylaminoimidazole-succinocarboxamide synthase [Ammoniphilus resinae]
MEKLDLLYEGKAKRVYKTSEEDLYWIEYKDDATAFNGEKKAQISGKGVLNNEISSILLTLLKEKGIENHLVKKLSATEQLVRQVEIIPIEVVVRNRAAGSFSKRLGVEEGNLLPKPIVEFYYKDDALGDPFINDDHIAILQLASPKELELIRETALKVNDILSAHLGERGITVVDFKLEFGKTRDGQVILADEISPDTCRFWDAKTNEKLDKDRFRRDLGNLIEAYQEIAKRLGGEIHV